MKFHEKLLLAFVWGIAAVGLMVLFATNSSAQTYQVQNLQVNGSATIPAGVINGTTIGSSAPSSGAFTTLDAAGAATLNGPVTGTGVTSLFAAPPAVGTATANTGAFTNLDAKTFSVTQPSPNTTTITANAYSNTQSSANVPTVDYQFNALADYGSFPDTTTHFGFVVNGGKSVSTANTTGSWQLFRVGYTGYGGGSTSSYITAAQLIMQPTPSGFNNSGNFTGSNPECIMVPGMTPTSCVGEEIDIETAVAPTNIRQGLRISDIGSASGAFGINTDSAIGIVNGSGIGFKNGILFGDPVTSSTFPVPAGGRLIQTVATSTALQSFVDFSNISGAPTSAAFTLPANIREFCFGSVSNCTGGSITSATNSNGGQLIFGNNNISFNWAGPEFSVSSTGVVNLSNYVQLQRMTVGALPGCNSALEGALIGVTDATSTTFNASAVGGGSNHMMAYCNGSAWTVH